MKRFAAATAVVVVVALLFGAHPLDPVGVDPVRQAVLANLAASQAAGAEAALAEAEALMREGTREAGQGQAAVLSGTDDPAESLNLAAAAFEAAATPVDAAQDPLAALGWTLRALDPTTTPPSLDLTGADLLAIGAQWRAAAIPLSAQADLRHAAEDTLDSLGEALAALDADDPEAALAALDEAEASLNEVRAFSADLTTLPFWIGTVDALIDATEAIALAAQAGDPVALAEAQAAYDAAADDAEAADRALTIALGEAVTETTAPANASSAAALRAVMATREALAGLSILP
ncbi:MAG TPA: hypothetical protein VIC63_01495 [Candidatus Limnocylindria bacterium]